MTEWPTLDHVLGARYSGDPYVRGVEWEEARSTVSPRGPTNRERVVRSLDLLVERGLVVPVAVPDEFRTPNERKASTLGGRWLFSATSPKLSPMGRAVLTLLGVNT